MPHWFIMIFMFLLLLPFSKQTFIYFMRWVQFIFHLLISFFDFLFLLFHILNSNRLQSVRLFVLTLMLFHGLRRIFVCVILWFIQLIKLEVLSLTSCSRTTVRTRNKKFPKKYVLLCAIFMRRSMSNGIDRLKCDTNELRVQQ